MSVHQYLLDEQTANASAGAAKQNSAKAEIDWNGGERLVVVAGAFDSCTVKLKFNPNDSVINAYVEETDGNLTFTQEGLKVIWLPGQGKLSAELTGAGASTSVTVALMEPGGRSQ